MFSSPAVPIYSSENAENNVMRKHGSQLMTRKPFIDRSVNGESPFDRKLLAKNGYKKETNISQKISPKLTQQEILEDSDLDGEDFIYSGKDVEDTYEDIWPSLVLGEERMMKFLSEYPYTKDTPPPSPNSSFDEYKPQFIEIESEFMELPKFMCELQEPPALCDDSFELDIPHLQPFDDLDCSI